MAGAAWFEAMRIMAGVGDLVQRTGDGRTGRVLGGRVIMRSGDTFCGLHCARGDKERGFLGCALKPRSMVYEWFDLKTTRMVFVIPRSEIAGMKPPYVCPGCFIHTYSNNMINRFHVQ
jgi:hypothetical protein